MNKCLAPFLLAGWDYSLGVGGGEGDAAMRGDLKNHWLKPLVRHLIFAISSSDPGEAATARLPSARSAPGGQER